MKKKLLIGSLVVVVILLCIFYFVVLKNKKNKVVTEGVEVVPTLNDKIDSDSTWCGTFQLVWNDMINEVVRQDILFKDNNDMVTNLNKKDFAQQVLKSKYADILFKAYDNQIWDKDEEYYFEFLKSYIDTLYELRFPRLLELVRGEIDE